MSSSPAEPKPDPAKPQRDYEVGYGRPPVARRFRRGGVGNPKGRPKRAKTVGRIIEEAMMTPVRIEVNGKPKIMTAQEVIIRNLVHSAARSDTRAIHALFSLKARYQDSADTTLLPSNLDASDREIIEEYLAKVGSGGPREASGLPASELNQSTEETTRTDANPRSDGASE